MNFYLEVNTTKAQCEIIKKEYDVVCKNSSLRNVMGIWTAGEKYIFEDVNNTRVVIPYDQVLNYKIKREKVDL